MYRTNTRIQTFWSLQSVYLFLLRNIKELPASTTTTATKNFRILCEDCCFWWRAQWEKRGQKNKPRIELTKNYVFIFFVALSFSIAWWSIMCNNGSGCSNNNFRIFSTIFPWLHNMNMHAAACVFNVLVRSFLLRSRRMFLILMEWKEFFSTAKYLQVLSNRSALFFSLSVVAFFLQRVTKTLHCKMNHKQQAPNIPTREM